MATREARQSAIKRAVDLVRSDHTGFLSRSSERLDRRGRSEDGDEFARRFPYADKRAAPGNENTGWFRRIEELVYMQPFFYLAGPMSDLPGFNFPEFDRVSALLRAKGYLISSPAEYEHEEARRAALNSPDGKHNAEVGPTWAECLARDVCVVSHPNCTGIILLKDWGQSRGARLETYVASRLAKPIYEFREDEDGFVLLAIDRDTALHSRQLPAELESLGAMPRWR